MEETDTADMEGGCECLEYARVADKGRSCNVRVDEKPRTPHRHISASYKMLYRAFGVSWERPRQWKLDMRSGIWNARVLKIISNSVSADVFWIETSEELFEKGNETSGSLNHRDIFD
jgi:hypothetical protein